MTGARGKEGRGSKEGGRREAGDAEGEGGEAEEKADTGIGWRRGKRRDRRE
jgi:hypothetical protein